MYRPHFKSVILPVPEIIWGTSNFGEKGAWAYLGTAEIFWVPPIISGTGKATDFKFGRFIHSIHPNESRLKIFEKGERRHIQGLPNVFKYPLLSQERKKFVRTFINRSQQKTKIQLTIWGKVAMGVARDSRNFSGHPYRAHRAVIFAIAWLSC